MQRSNPVPPALRACAVAVLRPFGAWPFGLALDAQHSQHTGGTGLQKHGTKLTEKAVCRGEGFNGVRLTIDAPT